VSPQRRLGPMLRGPGGDTFNSVYAGVPRASLVVVAATLPMFGLPAAGVLLILGIDQFLDMGRALTNVLSNGIATAVVAKWEDELEPEGHFRAIEVSEVPSD